MQTLGSMCVSQVDVCLLLVVTILAGINGAERVARQTGSQDLQGVVQSLSRQLMLQQLYVEERIRSDGCSGLKQIRIGQAGTKSYYAASHSGQRLASIHDHANNIRTVGMGEFIAVLNGVEFRTRHNDYKLVMSAKAPAGGRIEYGDVVDIPFPDVPQSVRGSPEQQIAEMREYFKAWQDQDTNHRDYRPYFKPVLCYLEGAWTSSESDNIDESFDSDRHFLDADSWFDLQEKIRYTSYTGRKSSEENFAYLPTTIMGMEGQYPRLAQWNYRILCHPLSRDVPLNRLNLHDDLASRMASGRDLNEHHDSRAARFKVSSMDKDRFREKPVRVELLDELMSEIPGKEGYNAVLTDDGLDGRPALNTSRDPLNAAYYSRVLLGPKDAMGTQFMRRGFADETLFVARTTQPYIAPLKVEKCNRRGKNCQMREERSTYAIPLEIIYLTPLQKWNPYDIPFMGKLSAADLKTLRGLGGSPQEPLSGTASRLFYQTPLAFYQAAGSTGDRADTSGDTLWAQSGDGQARKVVASGVRVHLPPIEGVREKIRIRYPIMPVHAEGSSVWKELEALKDIVLNPERYSHVLREEGSDNEGGDQGGLDPALPEFLEFELGPSRSNKVPQHTHKFQLDTEEVVQLMRGDIPELKVTTEQEIGHTHELVMRVVRLGNTRENIRLKYILCDEASRCWDRHQPFIRGPDRKIKRLLQQVLRTNQ